MDLTGELEDKQEEWFNEFDEAVSNQLLLLMSNQKKTSIIKIVKTWHRVNKYRIKKFGEPTYEGVTDSELKRKKLKLKSVIAVVKTVGVLIKPAKIDDIMNYTYTNNL